ncbi:hypothetical protein CONPUDRAFT_157704 [Coniophora puteana RWD-64-598 SS2]|uniref:Uncharacterized protein n=1 Tax=Coniophora puteana (strain RWD-64-598) TaxID=741705 RepID=R7SCJ6_CONPW|nr:uncharacterized protein CONPUDRAFT_157704 [Coniophora puteana RWD-64-598 SS2]XP_007775932.1 uncharacterized protein CONPUDRAFT_160597 [Coniophora puteana RWD-64-598 SS2]EIW73891.1 hypothetical protein CONPUDRAFT_160597 [Coniophora puteana RWD-64-598 SS2]EIW77455.1 hypothetical protein CONPUDRAFT_157704 [Coniophora puteana RWD-64-598 SS2]
MANTAERRTTRSATSNVITPTASSLPPVTRHRKHSTANEANEINVGLGTNTVQKRTAPREKSTPSAGASAAPKIPALKKGVTPQAAELVAELESAMAITQALKTRPGPKKPLSQLAAITLQPTNPPSAAHAEHVVVKPASVVSAAAARRRGEQVGQVMRVREKERTTGAKNARSSKAANKAGINVNPRAAENGNDCDVETP